MKQPCLKTVRKNENLIPLFPPKIPSNSPLIKGRTALQKGDERGFYK